MTSVSSVFVLACFSRLGTISAGFQPCASDAAGRIDYDDAERGISTLRGRRGWRRYAENPNAFALPPAW